MKKGQIIVGLFACAVAAVLGWQVFGSRRVPPGQPPMLDLTAANFVQFEKSFNDSMDYVRVLALLSPT